MASRGGGFVVMVRIHARQPISSPFQCQVDELRSLCFSRREINANSTRELSTVGGEAGAEGGEPEAFAFG